MIVKRTKSRGTVTAPGGRASLLLVTGPPGVGKTTALRKVCGTLQEWPMRGFWTEEVRSDGVRQGFRLVTLDGEGCTIADVRRPGVPRVGKYGVDVAAIDAVVRKVLAPDPSVRLFVIDEIGKMECLSGPFVEAVRGLITSGQPLLATVALRGGGLIEEVKCDPRARLIHLSRDNRDRLPGEIADILREALK
ncbi:MAG: AAA family ATPase [Betaproteobacteria bacterium]|nr:MAG: AAA family ATPase [Betaproteobacteria bacterium]